MCLLIAVFQQLPGCGLLILNNRDESRLRRTQVPRIVTGDRSRSAWLGGLDRQAGGTWLGINEFGLIVAVTNRPKSNVPSGSRSRGLLCRDLLGIGSCEEAVAEAVRQLTTRPPAGCNIAIFTRQEAVVVEAGDDIVRTSLSPGIHTLGNGRLDDDDDPRLFRAREEAATRIDRDADLNWNVEAMKTIAGLTAQNQRPALCISGDQWGTVSSTVIALTDDPAHTNYHYAAGPPHKTTYEDYSSLAQQLVRKE